MTFTMANIHAYLLLAILVVLAFVIVLQIANGVLKTFFVVVVCKRRRNHAIRVDLFLCLLREHWKKVQDYLETMAEEDHQEEEEENDFCFELVLVIYALLAILIALPLGILFQIESGVKTIVAVCKRRRNHAIGVDLRLLRSHICRIQQYWMAENTMLSAPLPFARTRAVYLRKSCSPLYWDTYHGQQDIAEAAKKPLRFRPELETILEDPIPLAPNKPVVHLHMLLEVPKNKPGRFQPTLETIVEERRFVSVRRPRNGSYGPFLQYAYHTNSISSKAPMDLDVLDHVAADDFGLSTELDKQMMAENSLVEQDGRNTEAATRKRAINSITSKKDSHIPRRSARIAELKTKTGIVLGSFFTVKGIRRSARLARSL